MHCLGAPRDGATAHSEDDPRLAGANPALRIFAADLEMAAGVEGCDLVHSHTWYANLAGHLAELLYDVPHVVTSHSLEPQRPWKAGAARRRLPALVVGRAHRLRGGRRRDRRQPASRPDVLASYPALDPANVHVIHNGIDADFYRPVAETDVVDGSASTPTGRRSCSSGGSPARRACRTCCGRRCGFDTAAQIVLLAGAADTPELAAETEAAVARLRRRAQRCRVGVRDAAAGGRPPGAQPRHGVRLPVDLRAARHRQPRGDGVRDGRRRQRRRRHPRGRRRR